MGLFSGLLKGVVGAVVPSLGSILGASGNSKAVKGAAAAQQAAIQQAQGILSSTYADAQGNFSPYMGAGDGATEQLRRLLGLGDSNTGVAVGGSPAYSATEQQAGALSGLKDSPLFQSLFNTGKESVLQSAAATGGVRGGNVNTALAENGENAFAQTLQQMIGNLSGLSSQGLSASSNLANLGSQNAAALAGLFGKSGDVSSGSILGQQNINNNLQQQITGQIQSAFGGGMGGAAGGGAGAAGAGGGILQSIFGAINGGSTNGGSIFTRGF